MNKTQKSVFLRKMIVKYADTTNIIDPWKGSIDSNSPVENISNIRDPWAGQKEIQNPDRNHITESRIFQAIKNLSGIMMYPNTYTINFPQEGVKQPWGAEVTFEFASQIGPQGDTSNQWGFHTGNPNIVNMVTNQLKAVFGREIINVSITYNKKDNRYSVQITETP